MPRLLGAPLGPLSRLISLGVPKSVSVIKLVSPFETDFLKTIQSVLSVYTTNQAGFIHPSE